MPILLPMGDEMTDRLDRVTKERVNNSADLIDITRELASRGVISRELPAYMRRELSSWHWDRRGGTDVRADYSQEQVASLYCDLAPTQERQNHMGLAWHWKRIDWVWVLVYCVLLPLCSIGAWVLIVKGISAVVK